MAKKKEVLSLEEKLEKALVPVKEQPYKVPSNWVWTRLVDIFQINPRSKMEDNLFVSFIPMANVNGGLESSYFSDLRRWGEVKKGFTHFREGDVVFAKISPCFENRKSAILNKLENQVGAGTTELVVLRQEKIYNRYVFWYMNTDEFIKKGSATFSGTVGQQRVNMDFIREYPFPLPPLAEQRRIVEQVESLFSQLDEAKELAQTALDSFGNRKSAILHKAFTGELTKKWREKTEVSFANWDEKTIGQLFDVFSGKGFKEQEYVTDGIKLLRISNVTYDNLIWNDTKYLPQSYLESSSDLVLRPSDIVIALNRPITNGKLKVSVVETEEPLILYQRVGCLRNKTNDQIKFIKYTLQSESFLKQVEMNLQGSDQPYINLPPLKKLTIPICSSPEQKEIVCILDSIFEKETIAKECANVIEQIDLMKKAILAKAFRGELDTNNETDESALVYLKEILKGE